jgi:hypothetical protein
MKGQNNKKKLVKRHNKKFFCEEQKCIKRSPKPKKLKKENIELSNLCDQQR